MPTGKNPYGVSFIQTSAGAMITGEIKRYATYKAMMEETAPTRLASVANASRDTDYDVPVEHQGGILYQRDYINSTWILLYTDADLSIPTYVEWDNILHVPAWVGGVSNNRVKLIKNTVGVPRTTYYSFGNKTDLSRPYRLLLPLTGTEGLQLGDEIVLEQYENTSIVLYEKPEGVEAYEFEQTVVDTDGKTYFYIYTTPYYTFDVDAAGKPVANTVKPLTCNSYKFIYTETDGGIKVWRPCIVKDNIGPVITHLKNDIVDHAMARDPHPTYIRRDEIMQYLPTVETATISVTGVVRLATYGDIDAGSIGAISVTPDIMKLYLVNNYSQLGHTHSVTEVFRQVNDTLIRLDTILDGKSDVGHTHAFYELTNIPFETVLTVENRESTNTIVTPKMLAYEIENHKHSMDDINGLQEALDNKSDDGHTHAVDDIAGLQLMIDESRAALYNQFVTPVTPFNDIFSNKGVLLIPIKGGITIAVQWGLMPVKWGGFIGDVDFNSIDNRIVSMNPVYHITLTSVGPSGTYTDSDNLIHLLSVSSTGFKYRIQDWNDYNRGIACKWLAIGRYAPGTRTLVFQWGTHAALKNTAAQELVYSLEEASFANLSRRDIAHEYNANFMLVDPLAAPASSFTTFLNSMDTESSKEPCDWFVYGRSNELISQNQLIAPTLQGDGTYSIGAALWLLSKPQCDWGNHWDKFRINATTSFVIIYGYVDISESKTDGTPVDVAFPSNISLTGFYHASFLIQNAKKQSVYDADSQTTSTSLSVDREVYLESLEQDAGGHIIGFHGKSKKYGNHNNSKLKYRVYWTIYGYLTEDNNITEVVDGQTIVRTQPITGASIVTNNTNTSHKYTWNNTDKVIIDTPIGGNDVIVTIPILANNGVPTTDIVWRFGSMKVYQESTMTTTYDKTKTYYVVCKDDMPFQKDQMISTDFTCDGRTSAPGPHTAFHDGIHDWPFNDEEGGIPVTVVFHGSPEVESDLTWMAMGFKSH